MNRRAGEFIQARLHPELDPLFGGAGLVSMIDERDPQVVSIRYPAAFSQAYIRPDVRLEIGPLASWVPSAPQPIRPYAAEVFPRLFRDPVASVITIAAERTFWEKATILHQEAHRPGLPPERYSRHYYDLYKLAASTVRQRSLAEMGLLEDVVRFKMRFYPSRWARYDLAAPGTFHLLPADAAKIANLERDYHSMEVMLFGEVPEFEAVKAGLKGLEAEINASRPVVKALEFRAG